MKSSFLSLPANAKGRDIFVGDVHGEISMLELGLGALGFDPAVDRLVSVGDLVDRGENSFAVLDLYAGSPWFHAVLGNHEAMVEAAVSGAERAAVMALQNGAEWLTGIQAAGRRKVATTIAGMPLALEIRHPAGHTVGVVHAEVRSKARWEQVRTADLKSRDVLDPSQRRMASSLLWGRRRHRQMNLFLMGRFLPSRASEPDEVPGIDLIISGHNILRAPRDPRLEGNCLCIDTGAFEPDGRLTFVDLMSNRYLQVCRLGAGPELYVRPLRPLA